jgi:hypothetical protein
MAKRPRAILTFTFNEKQRAAVLKKTVGLPGGNASTYLQEIEAEVDGLLLHEPPTAPTPKQIAAMTIRFQRFFLSIERGKAKDAANFVSSRLGCPTVATVLKAVKAIERSARLVEAGGKTSRRRKSLIGIGTGLAEPTGGRSAKAPSPEFILAITSVMEDHGVYRDAAGAAAIVIECCKASGVPVQSTWAIEQKVRKTLSAQN